MLSEDETLSEAAALGLEDFPNLGVPVLGVPIIRTMILWGLYRGPLISGNYHVAAAHEGRYDGAPKHRNMNMISTG